MVKQTPIQTRYIILAVLFVCLATADSLVMHLSLAAGAVELNPLVAYLLRFGEIGFWCSKGLIAAGAVAFFVHLSRKYPVQAGKILVAMTILIGFDLAWDFAGLVYLGVI
jgi:hypothetical protein